MVHYASALMPQAAGAHRSAVSFALLLEGCARITFNNLVPIYHGDERSVDYGRDKSPMPWEFRKAKIPVSFRASALTVCTSPSRTEYRPSLVHFEKRFGVAVISEMQSNAPGGRPDRLNSRCLRSAIRAERRQHFSFTLEDYLLLHLLQIG